MKGKLLGSGGKRSKSHDAKVRFRDQSEAPVSTHLLGSSRFSSSQLAICWLRNRRRAHAPRFKFYSLWLSCRWYMFVASQFSKQGIYNNLKKIIKCVDVNSKRFTARGGEIVSAIVMADTVGSAHVGHEIEGERDLQYADPWLIIIVDAAVRAASTLYRLGQLTYCNTNTHPRCTTTDDLWVYDS